MISHLRLRNFICFRDLALPFGAIAVLSGSNGTGKSSTLQAMLLLRQSYQLGLLNTRGLALNGDIVRLGSGKDALFEGAEEDVISFAMSIKGGQATPEIQLPRRQGANLQLSYQTYRRCGADTLFPGP
jgi:predicted ATPase